MSLAEAREQAHILYRAVKAGLDPLAEREARAAAEKAAAQRSVVQAITFADVVERYIAAHEASYVRWLKRRWPIRLGTRWKRLTDAVT